MENRLNGLEVVCPNCKSVEWVSVTQTCKATLTRSFKVSANEDGKLTSEQFDVWTNPVTKQYLQAECGECKWKSSVVGKDKWFGFDEI